jgi:GDP-mannose 6-dehydrogenase
MDISIFGLGYVGVVSAACLAARGHNVIGVDVNQSKVDMINQGVSPIIEKDLPELLSQARDNGRLHATSDPQEAISKTALSFICVGTPSKPNGSLDTRHVERVCAEIGSCLKRKPPHHFIVLRSTVLPGTNRNLIIPILENSSGLRNGGGFSLCFNPEFMREATAIYDFNNPPKTVVGAETPAIAQSVLALYADVPGPKITASIEVAEMVKYVDNNFHALKVTFANEIGAVCSHLGIDSHEVMNIFMQDTKLNISTYYFKPGLAFGGSCLPKDLRAMTYLAKTHDLDTPVLNALMPSNRSQVHATVERIIDYDKKHIGFAGISFKAGTDDLRESPIIDMIETLIGKGYSIKIFDRNVSLARLIGANRQYINERIPHIASLLVESLDDLLKDSELIVIANQDELFKRLVDESRDDQIIFDLVRIADGATRRPNYQGLYW